MLIRLTVTDKTLTFNLIELIGRSRGAGGRRWG
jgi:hypothetical protein